MAPKKTTMKKTATKKPAKRGRPPVHPPQDNRRVMVRCTQAEETAYKSAADREDLKVSPWARKVLGAAAIGPTVIERESALRTTLARACNLIEEAVELLEEFSTIDETEITIRREQAKYIRQQFGLPDSAITQDYFAPAAGVILDPACEPGELISQEIEIARHPDGSTVTLKVEGELPEGFEIDRVLDPQYVFPCSSDPDPLDVAESLADIEIAAGDEP